MTTDKNKTLVSREEINSLIQKAREGSNESLSFLTSKYSPLIESQVNKFYADYMSNQDKEDMHQEAISAFCDAICKYDCRDDGVEFGLFAKVCINNRLITFLRAYKAQSNRGVSSLDEMQGYMPADGDDADPLQNVVDDENIRMLVQTIQSNLSPYEARIWWLYASGLSAAQIAKKIKCSDVRSVNNAIYRTRRKLRDMLGDK
ncbi:MAG: sigma-70 family RNA polymerase sigma factor [Ruminococcaceae bacterium]|nr:sigma-70 family RNA polymerase sigma factor [Oscillospiraceae bacterium]